MPVNPGLIFRLDLRIGAFSYFTKKASPSNRWL